MSENGNKPADLATLWQQNTSDPQQQQALLDATTPAQPPTYQQATAGNEPTVVLVNEPALIYGPRPVDVQCPYCHNFCRTRLRHEPNSRTHLIALLLCLFQFYCCVCLPYCIGSCMNVNHYCGMCDKYLGTFTP